MCTVVITKRGDPTVLQVQRLPDPPSARVSACSSFGK
jgi:hypothetical protein